MRPMPAPRGRRPAHAAALVAGLLALGACQPSTTGVSASSPDAKAAGGVATSGFAQFSDIAIPEGAKMDLERSLILGSREKWIGRLALTTALSGPAAFDFYQSQMGRYGWAELSAIRTEISVLTFQSGERVATVQIQTSSLGSTLVDVTVTPKGVKPAAN